MLTFSTFLRNPPFLTLDAHFSSKSVGRWSHITFGTVERIYIMAMVQYSGRSNIPNIPLRLLLRNASCAYMVKKALNISYIHMNKDFSFVIQINTLLLHHPKRKDNLYILKAVSPCPCHNIVGMRKFFSCEWPLNGKRS